MIFFSDFYILRLIASENILIDCTFSFPKGYLQTLIIMYFDVIILKMIRGIFICKNIKLMKDINVFFKIYFQKLKDIQIYIKGD